MPRTNAIHPSALTRRAWRVWLPFASKVLNQPAVLTVVGALIGSLLIPIWLDQIETSRTRSQARAAILAKHVTAILEVEDNTRAALTLLWNVIKPWKDDGAPIPPAQIQAALRDLEASQRTIFITASWTQRVELEMKALALLDEREMSDVSVVLHSYASSVQNEVIRGLSFVRDLNEGRGTLPSIRTRLVEFGEEAARERSYREGLVAELATILSQPRVRRAPPPRTFF